MKYAVVIEKAQSNYSAYVPDLPGCVAAASTIEEVEKEIREAIEFHIEGMRKDGEAAPQPSSSVEYIEVA
jgi:predicted RNase H-like HicB family nuclease